MRVNDTPSTKDAKPVDAGGMTLLGHDLRAAVSDIIGGLRLIDQEGTDPATRLQLERVRTASETLARLLEEAMAAIFGEDAVVVAQRSNVQLERFLYDVEMRWSGRASEKGLQLTFRLEPDLPQVLMVDRVALDRILSNILSNAIKYTDRGSIWLDVGRSPEGALRFSVQDQGPGFSPEALARLFQYRGRPDGTGKPGQGLGMHITKNLSELLGATISVENLAEGGARVTLELPVSALSTGLRGDTPDLPDLSRTKVLVAEDSATNQLLIGQMLSSLGAEYEVAADGVQALNWLEREEFDLALIDIEMPRLGGIDVIRAVRANDRLYSRMPVVAITAYVLRANRDAIYAAGADAILAKPLGSVEAFGAAIGNVLRRAALSPEEVIAEPCAELAEFHRESFDRLLEVAGPEASRELLQRLCTDLRNAERGLVAGLAEGNLAAIRSETHVLIALAGAVGAERLCKLAQTLNAVAHRREGGDLSLLGEECLAQLDRLIHFISKERASRGDG
ncbi:MAG TPA: response regulator [Albidovulum sp.]|uniref:ATP-binding protein n=1 Tax=Albidovulum sp. TaxID=1872424 RepID=UPI002BE6CCB4|nr:response regulator [Albidovulum sp.]